jgi:AcrR family transcriptional regulator
MPKKTSYPKSEISKQTLIDAAKELFINKGYHGTSMRDIAEASNLSLGSFYNHFQDKEMVFEAIIHQVNPMPHLIEIMRKGIPENAEIQGLLRYLIREMVGIYEREPELLNLVMIELVEFDGRHIPSLFERIFPLMQELSSVIAKHESALKDYQPFALLHSLIAMVWGYFLSSRLLSHLNPSPPLVSLDDYIEIYLKGILKQEN